MLFSFLYPPERAKRKKIREDFLKVTWPKNIRPVEMKLPLVAKLTCAFDAVCFFLVDKDSSEIHGQLALSFRFRYVVLQSLTLKNGSQNKGIGSDVMGFVIDELAGHGVKKITLRASKTWGGYMWNKLGFKAFKMPRGLLGNYFKIAHQIPEDLRMKIYYLLLRSLFDATSYWRLSDFNHRLASGEEIGKALFKETDWRGVFRTSDTACVRRLKNYTHYPFRNL